LSPYISRGVISTSQVYQYIRGLGLPWGDTEKLIQELAWRDYWQQVWIVKGDGIKKDLKKTQTPISNYQIPQAIINANTGINALDNAIEQLYLSGYMHNHMRMYIASVCCNIANCHWYEPARWMYSHLLDGDTASNYLSWQWVAGAFSTKKYFANQDNINKFFKGSQRNTFLDVEYESFEELTIPSILKNTASFDLETVLPDTPFPIFEKNKTTLIYNYYNIDPYWHKGEDVQRVFLLESSFFTKYPVSEKCLEFALELTKNIEGIELFVGEFSELLEYINPVAIIYKEHPANDHYKGKEESRDWICNIKGYFPSFFGFWKKCKKALEV
jgi:deoxyribodipyrimidine photo-lyase